MQLVNISFYGNDGLEGAMFAALTIIGQTRLAARHGEDGYEFVIVVSDLQKRARLIRMEPFYPLYERLSQRRTLFLPDERMRAIEINVIFRFSPCFQLVRSNLRTGSMVVWLFS